MMRHATLLARKDTRDFGSRLARFAPLVFVSAASVVVASPTVDRYVESRDAYIERFSGTDELDTGAYEDALVDLEQQLRAIVAPMAIEGFPGAGRISLEGLTRGELGFGQVDGIRFDSKREWMLETTVTLLDRYVAAHAELPRDLTALSGTGDFYRRALTVDAAVTPFAEIPLEHTSGASHARALLGLTAQDIGPFVPEDIFVFVVTGDRVFVVRSSPAAEVTEIPRCREAWNASTDRQHVEERAFDAWRSCFQQHASEQPYFVALRQQAQSVVDRLRLASGTGAR